ncbi:MAG: hypothetical protein ACRBCI_00825 [Cellvibrionaceae bacterium]
MDYFITHIQSLFVYKSIVVLLVGIAIACAVVTVANLTDFEKDRIFYPTVLIVIASYYVLFALISGEAIIKESLVALLFFIVAMIGYYRCFILIGIALILHGLFDLVHSMTINNSGIPNWWPLFCLGVDIVLGIRVIYLFHYKNYYR